MDETVSKWMIEAPTPEPISASTETKAVFENRGTQTMRPATRRATGRLHQSTSSPVRPPIQTEPATRWTQSSATDNPRGEVCAAWPESPGTSSVATPASNAPAFESNSAIERCARSGRSTQSAIEAASTKSPKVSSRSRYPRPNAESRTSGSTFPRSKAERSANCAVAIATYTGVAINAITAEIPNATETARSRVSETRRTSGRAVAMRRMKSPIDAMTDRKTIARAVTRLGVAAVSEIDGTGNCGAGPGLGPTANVKAPRTGWPSTEITRQ